MHHGERVGQRQCGEIDSAQFGNAVLREISACLGVDQLALNQVVAFGVGIENVGSDANLVQAGHRCALDFVNFFQLRNAFGQGFSNGAFLR